MQELFRVLSERVNRFSGAPAGFALALLAVLVWALTGPVFHFSTDWQLVINTGTTIITFLMTFLINGAQSVAQERIESLEGKVDEHVTTTAKQHAEELRANTKLTREIHAMLIERRDGKTGRYKRAS